MVQCEPSEKFWFATVSAGLVVPDAVVADGKQDRVIAPHHKGKKSIAQSLSVKGRGCADD